MLQKKVKCKNCGGEIMPGASFCTHCGSKCEEATPTAGKKKKWWIWCIVALVVLAAIGSTAGDKPEERTDTPKTTEDTLTTDEAGHDVADTKTEQEVVADPAEEKDTELDLETRLALFETAVKASLSQNEANGVTYDVKVEETQATINMWSDGVAMGAALAATGDSSAKEAWTSMVGNICSMSSSMSELADSAGLEDYLCCVNVLNDQNKDNVLLSTLNGVVVYDAVEAAS